MGRIGPPVLAFLIASLLVSVELLTSKYPRTFFLLKRCWAIYAYALIYGAIGFGAALGLTSLIQAEAIKVEGLGLSSPWVQSLAIGLTIRAFLHIRLFSVGVGGQSFPVGVETLVQLFEPWLLRTIEVEQFNAARDFIAPRAKKYTDLADVKARIRAGIPQSLPSQEKTAFLADVERATAVLDALELYLSFLGRRSFDRVFPPDERGTD